MVAPTQSSSKDSSIGAFAVDVPLWAWMVLVVALFGSYLMLQENGLLTSHWETMHEFFHDGRHALGFPCH